jgi:hypothetical protein
MRISVKKTVAASLAALTLGLAVVSTPASAHTWHGGWGHHGFWGPGLVFGLAAGAIATSAYGYNYDCVRYRPVYDAYGNYVGREPVNIC